MTQELTPEKYREAAAELDGCRSAEDVREVFKRHYHALGWKRLCKLFVLRHGPDELWLAEQDRATRPKRAKGDDE